MLINNQVAENADFTSDWQDFLSNVDDNLLKNLTGNLQHYVNGKNLACPMPLLKLKMALKNTEIGNYVYMTATDSNSQTDIGAFCQYTNLDFFVVKVGQECDVFHILVRKNS